MTTGSSDQELSRRFAEILADMHDNDETGPHNLLSGYQSGPAVALVHKSDVCRKVIHMDITQIFNISKKNHL